MSVQTTAVIMLLNIWWPCCLCKDLWLCTMIRSATHWATMLVAVTRGGTTLWCTYAPHCVLDQAVEQGLQEVEPSKYMHDIIKSLTDEYSIFQNLHVSVENHVFTSWTCMPLYSFKYPTLCVHMAQVCIYAQFCTDTRHSNRTEVSVLLTSDRSTAHVGVNLTCLSP